MKRLEEAWFEYRGIRSSVYGIRIFDMPVRTMPALRGKTKDIAGASGSAFLSDGTYTDVTVTVEFSVDNAAQLSAVSSWLTGKGTLIFSDEPGLAYDARIVTPPRRSSLIIRMDAQRYTVSFSCHPFRRIWPEPADIRITASGSTLKNPGSAPASPRIKIAGSGEFMLSIGREVMWFTEISGGGIIVDSELMDALTFDGTQLANNKVSGTPFLIQPGDNTVSWAVEEGSVTSITITPRWRCF